MNDKSLILGTARHVIVVFDLKILNL